MGEDESRGQIDGTKRNNRFNRPIVIIHTILNDNRVVPPLFVVSDRSFSGLSPRLVGQRNPRGDISGDISIESINNASNSNTSQNK